MRKASLIIVQGSFSGSSFAITSPSLLIGRTPTSELTLVDEAVSREHAVIHWEDDRYTIEDLGTTNGTRVNGKRVNQMDLCEGDEIEIGTTVFQLRFESESE